MGAPTSSGGGSGPSEPFHGEEPDWDARWRELTESLGDLDSLDGPEAEVDRPADAGPATTHDIEDADEPPAPATADAGGTEHAATLGGPRDYSPPEADERFVPADPGRVAGDPVTTIGWCALVGAPVALILILVLWRDAPGAVVAACLTAFLAGAVTLLWRMPARRSDDDHDDGAVV